VAALLYKLNKRWEHSIALSKQDAQFKDAIDTASQSGDQHLAEGLLHYFVGKGDKESFASTLFTCYPLIRADVAMELAWRHRITDFVMPFMIQYIRDTSSRISSLEAKLKPKEDEAAAAAAAAAAGLHDGGFGAGGYSMGVLAIADVAYNQSYNYAPGYGAPGGMPAPGMGGMSVPGMGAPGYGVPGGYSGY
jgi:clathrin heavy chain